MSDLPIPDIAPVPNPVPDISAVPGSGGTGSDKKLAYVALGLSIAVVLISIYVTNKRKAQNVPKESPQH